ATQKKLSSGLNAPVASPQSTSSLQLSLENEKLKEARAAYIAALQAAGEKEADIIGYAVAINGRVSTANLYPSNGLFRKMWTKQLAAAVTEAIGESQAAAPAAAPPAAPAASGCTAATSPNSGARAGGARRTGAAPAGRPSHRWGLRRSAARPPRGPGACCAAGRARPRR